jgi:Flp pilus assembly protein TadB
MMRKNESHPSDEKIASIAEQIANGNLDGIASDDAETRAMSETMLALHTAFTNDEEEAAKKRIHSKLRKNWMKIQTEEKHRRTKKSSFFHNFRWQPQRQTGLVIAFAMVFLFLALAPTFLTMVPGIAGSAGAITTQKFTFLVLGIIFAIVLIWGLRSKK